MVMDRLGTGIADVNLTPSYIYTQHSITLAMADLSYGGS